MTIIDKKDINVRDYILTFLLIMFSGNPIFSWKWAYIVFAVVLIIFESNKIFDKSYEFKVWRMFSICIIMLFLLQFFVFEWNSIEAFGNLLAKIFCAFAIIKITGDKFRSIMFIEMYWLCLIAIILFTLYSITGFALDWFGTEHYLSMGLWGHHSSDISGNWIRIRNNGPFWEPGAFAGYIMMTMMFFLDDFIQLYKENKWKVLCIIVALITTFSTTGYLIAFVYAGYVLLKSSANKYSFLLVPVIVGAAIYAFSLDFMGDKIQQQVAATEDVDIYGARVDHGRFTSMVFDMYYIKKHPVIGNGLHSRTRYADHLYMGDNLVGFGNGLTGFAACMGLPLVFLFFYNVYKNKSYIGLSKWLIVLMLLMLLYGEYYQNFPLIYVFMFILITHEKEIV